MISFRYHVVSIVAVFLALALGVVVGTTALNGPITTNLRDQVDSLKKDRSSLASQNQQLQNQASNANQFANTFGAQVVKGQLSGANVLLISMPGAKGSVTDGITKQLNAAGATINGRIEINGDYTDPKHADDIRSLVSGANAVHPIGLTLPSTDDAGQLGGALLGFVLSGQGTSSDIEAALSAFTTAQMLKVVGNGVKPAKLAVVIGTGSMPANDAGSTNQLALVTQMQLAGIHTLVAGDNDSATAGGLVARVRTFDADKNTVSTVDNADTAMGQVSSVLALAEVNGGKSGAYGTGNGASALFPQPQTSATSSK
ncbi:MAG: copper transporter [Actinobacteria bacterium]|nr:copper transporter [Actinomycetota bacterium]